MTRPIVASRCRALVGVLSCALFATPSFAQPPEPPPSTNPEVGDIGAPENATDASTSGAAPVVVIPIPSGEGLTENVANAVMETISAGLRPKVQRREVRVVTTNAIVGAAIQCSDDACFGQAVATAGGAVGVFVRLSRPASDAPVDLRFEVRSAVTGELRQEATTFEVPADSAADPAAMVVQLAGAFDALAPAMPPAPARATVLIASNVDGAAVAIDGEALGETPIAPVELAPGRHTLTVSRAGFETFNRSVEVSLDGVRVNVDLEPAPEIAAQMQRDDASEAEDFVQGTAPSSEPIYKKWWLWAAVGGAVILITAIAVGVAVAGGGGSQPDGFEIPPIPSGGM